MKKVTVPFIAKGDRPLYCLDVKKVTVPFIAKGDRPLYCRDVKKVTVPFIIGAMRLFLVTLCLLAIAVAVPLGASSAKPSPPQEAGDDPADELNPQERRRLEKRIGAFYYARKRVRCTYCDGLTYLVCSKCKGDGRLYAYYPNTGKVDWDKTRNCPKCKTAGKVDCSRKTCTIGFNEKNLRKILWDLRSPEYREELEEHLGVGELYITGFLKAMAIQYKHEKAETKIGFTEIAGELGVDYSKFWDFIRERSRYKNLLTPFTKFKILETGFRSKVRVRELRNGKVVREFLEVSEWISSDGDWYLHSLKKTRI